MSFHSNLIYIYKVMKFSLAPVFFKSLIENGGVLATAALIIFFL